MNEYFKNAFNVLTQEQKEELALCIGLEMLDVHLPDREVSPIVMIAWDLYSVIQTPDLANFY